MTARILLFPHRRRFRAARWSANAMAAGTAEAADAHLDRALGRIATALEDLGFDEATIAREQAGFEALVRAELWRFILTPQRPGGAA